MDTAGFDPATCSLQGRIASLVHERPERAACAARSLIVLSSLFLLLKRAPGRFGGRPCGAGRGYLPLGASWTAGRARPWTTCPAQGAVVDLLDDVSLEFISKIWNLTCTRLTSHVAKLVPL